MTIWYLADPNRYVAELGALRSLEAEVDWLTVEGERLDPEMRVCVDLSIRARSRVFDIRLRYPQTYPFTPPSVLPRESGAHWSGHQYGPGGELCLEFGPDNWINDLTGADMVRSAERLLAAEAADDRGVPVEVPSRHAETLGQTLRPAWGRLLVTQGLSAYLADAPRGATAAVDFVGLLRSETYVLTVRGIRLAAVDAWKDAEVPEMPHFAAEWRGAGFGLPPGEPFPDNGSRSTFLASLEAYGFVSPEGFDKEVRERVLVWTDEDVRLYWLNSEDDSVLTFKTVRAGGGVRLDPEHASLATKTVGIVGCGSAGSKVAVSLARAGVRNFVLMDDDVFLPENLTRHDLDWLSMGEHKVNALARRLGLVAPGTNIILRRQRLGAQEASGGVDGALTKLETCDLIIDATAQATVFNLLAAVSKRANKPIVWLEVFGGGIGGLIARSRPNADPSPQVARARIDAWCAEQNVRPLRPIGDYAAVGETEPLIADDADVAAIAAHAARFAIDLLIERTPSDFPKSAYFIGLRKAWLFEEPFFTIPLDLGQPEPSPERQDVSEEAIQALRTLFKLDDHGPTASS